MMNDPKHPSPPEEVTCIVAITGKVQGVFYRQFCLQQANELKIKGTVQNLPDGNVQLIISGPREQLDEMVKRCQTGPSHSRVDSVQVQQRPYTRFERFSVLPTI